MPIERQDALDGVTASVTELTEDWGLDEDLTPETRLVEDLCFASVDVLELMGLVDVRFGRQLPYDRLLVEDGTYRDDITIGDLATFIVEHHDQPSPEPQGM